MVHLEQDITWDLYHVKVAGYISAEGEESWVHTLLLSQLETRWIYLVFIFFKCWKIRAFFSIWTQQGKPLITTRDLRSSTFVVFRPICTIRFTVYHLHRWLRRQVAACVLRQCALTYVTDGRTLRTLKQTRRRRFSLSCVGLYFRFASHFFCKRTQLRDRVTSWPQRPPSGLTVNIRLPLQNKRSI